MRYCQEHWDMTRKSIEDYGLSNLVSRDGKEAIERTKEEIEEGPSSSNFDPLMSHNWHWTSAALKNGGLYIMTANPSGENEGHYCPICEFVKKAPNFDAKTEIDHITAQMRDWAKAEGLIKPPQ